MGYFPYYELDFFRLTLSKSLKNVFTILCKESYWRGRDKKSKTFLVPPYPGDFLACLIKYLDFRLISQSVRLLWITRHSMTPLSHGSCL